jgi:pilus assembly protein Flp/PilA
MSDKLLTHVKNAVELTRNDERGATMVEYGLMVALIAVIVAAAVGPLGTALATLFGKVTTAVTGA